MPLCHYGDPILRQKSQPVAAITPEIRELAARMLATMEESRGVGLAAPQVGRSLCLITIKFPPPDPQDPQTAFTSPGEHALFPLVPLALVNPVLSEPSPQTCVLSQGCLSIPEVTVEVERPEFVTLSATLLNGSAITYRCGGFLAQVLQHEVDHLRGILITDYLDEKGLRARRQELDKLKIETLKHLRSRRHRA